MNRTRVSFRPTLAEMALIVIIAGAVGYALYSEWFRYCCLNTTRGTIAIALLPALLTQLALSGGHINSGSSFAPALFSVGIAIQFYVMLWLFRWALAWLDRKRSYTGNGRP
jgi:hypothetical protein